MKSNLYKCGKHLINMDHFAFVGRAIDSTDTDRTSLVFFLKSDLESKGPSTPSLTLDDTDFNDLVLFS